MRFLLTALIILVLDQSSKFFFLNRADLPWWLIEDQVGFELAMNEGVAFSLPITGELSIVLSLAVTCLLLFYYCFHMKRSWLADVTVGLIVGGAIGNVIDRFTQGAVIDFIKVFSWPTFNVADSAISIGFILLIVFFYRVQKFSKG